MGKTKRATRKELEDVIAGVIQELNLLHNEIKTFGNYFAMYVEYKGDSLEFTEHLKQKISKAKANTSNVGGTSKGGKQDRYRKITQPL